MTIAPKLAKGVTAVRAILIRKHVRTARQPPQPRGRRSRIASLVRRENIAIMATKTFVRLERPVPQAAPASRIARHVRPAWYVRTIARMAWLVLRWYVRRERLHPKDQKVWRIANHVRRIIIARRHVRHPIRIV